MLWLSRKDIEHISRRLLRDYLKKVPQKVDHIDPADFAEKMCGLQFTFADISEAHDAIGLTATSGVIITIPQRDGTRLDYELDGKTAFIDQSLVAENQIGRLNFTMMHEAAHQLFWMLYPEEYEAQTPRCVFRMTDEHLCIHLYELMDSLPLYYSEYFADKEERRKLFEKLKYDIETIIKDFLNSIGSDKLYMDTPPELEGLSNRK